MFSMYTVFVVHTVITIFIIPKRINVKNVPLTMNALFAQQIQFLWVVGLGGILT